MNFMAAEGICEGFGGHLTSIHSIFENVFLYEEASTFFTDSVSIDFWNGANTLYKPGSWTWMDGMPFDFTDWDKGQPQNTTDKNCGAVKLQGGQWISDNCDKLKPFVCLKKVFTSSTTSAALTTTTKPKPKSCDLSWTAHDGFCYKVYDNGTWLEAEERCKVDDAHLASIHDIDENLFVANLSYYPEADGCKWPTNAWVGLFTEDNQAHWNWTDKTHFNYANWMPGKPNLPQYKLNCCIMFLTPCTTTYVVETGQFDNLPCDTILPKFICKKLPS
uniref:C-type lectin domain-containing protein n=1 Tax=Panagrolaimus superbus TaxID=310955 RepID=A0A914Y212_9BILA